MPGANDVPAVCVYVLCSLFLTAEMWHYYWNARCYKMKPVYAASPIPTHEEHEDAIADVMSIDQGTNDHVVFLH